MSDVFGELFGGSRGTNHLPLPKSDRRTSFADRARSLVAAIESGEARTAESIEQLVAKHELVVDEYSVVHGAGGDPDSGLAMELAPIEDDANEPRALVLLKSDLRAAMASGRLFFLDSEFEVSK